MLKHAPKHLKCQLIKEANLEVIIEEQEKSITNLSCPRSQLMSQFNKNDIERIQKVAVRIILGKNYKNYNEGLKTLRLEDLNTRREETCLKFAEKCLANEKLKSMFPKSINLHKMKKRKNLIFKEFFSKTKWLPNHKTI